MTPKTSWGRLLTIVYALIGIPLTFLYLSNIGNFLADCFRLFYKRVCCDVLCCEKCERKRKRHRLKQRRRREIMAAAAQQRNFRFGEWTDEMTRVNLEPKRVEMPEVGDPILRQSSSSWITVSTSSAAAEGEGSAGNEAAAAAMSADRETNILEVDTSATSDDGRTDEGLDIRETDIIGDDDEDDDEDCLEHNHQLPLRNTNPTACSDVTTKRRRRFHRSHSDTKLDAADQTSSTRLASNRRVYTGSTNTSTARAAKSHVIRRSASVKARSTGCLLTSLHLSTKLSQSKVKHT